MMTLWCQLPQSLRVGSASMLVKVAASILGLVCTRVRLLNLHFFAAPLIAAVDWLSFNKATDCMHS